MAEHTAHQPQLISSIQSSLFQGSMLQRQCACGAHSSGGECASCRDKREQSLQRAAVSSGPASAPSIVQDVLRSPGQPLDGATRAFMEPRFGHDFSQVRVHTDVQAAQSAQAVNALAYTVGRDIVFDTGRYAPATTAGRRLLAHELTHTIQQRGRDSAPQPKLAVGALDDQYEREAEHVASHVMMASETVPASATTQERAGVVQRACKECAGKIQGAAQIGDDEEKIEVPTTAEVSWLQRLGDLTKVPPDLACPVASTSPGSSGTSILFTKNSPTLGAAEQASLSAVAAAWHAGGEAGVLRLDGYASVEGSDELNWRLSCDRAQVVATELQTPSDGSPGVPATNIQLFAQGETSEFSTNLPPNRRVVITTGGAPAPGPTCGLTVAGPADVDHYCAAYVPSDAASCGVFPAPNITLTASGAAAGATITWSIIRGGANASIVGPNTGPSVAIRGDTASATRNDVTVQVTDGSCTKTHLVTVHQPSSMIATQAPTVTPTFVQTMITYTVRDQFGAAMGANICVDETITLCATSHPGPMAFGDAGTNASGQVNDNLSIGPVPGGIPAGFCRKFDQTLTAGGCGPLLHNTILLRASGITLTHGSSCAPGDPCP